jgi:hypothetical protein
MGLINEVDKPGSDIENYVVTLDRLLADKVDKINSLRVQLRKFNIMLKDVIYEEYKTRDILFESTYIWEEDKEFWWKGWSEDKIIIDETYFRFNSLITENNQFTEKYIEEIIKIAITRRFLIFKYDDKYINRDILKLINEKLYQINDTIID